MEKIVLQNAYFWYAVYVRSRAEKKAQLELQKIEIETFLPLQRKLRQWSDRKKWVELPLIPGYLFVKASLKEYNKVLNSNHIVSYVRFEGKAAVIPENQIDYLRSILRHSDVDIEIVREPLKTGQMVKVVSGPFIGLVGKLTRIKGKNKVAIELEQLGYAAMVEIQIEDIESA